MKAYRIMFLLLVAIAAVPRGPLPAESRVNRPLTSEEMGVPEGRYQEAMNMERNFQVQFPPPQVKPEIEWSVEIPYPTDYTNLLVDSEGGVWHTRGLGIVFQNVIARLDRDGSLDWAIGNPFINWTYPVVACDGAVVCREGSVFSSGDPVNRLRCFDLSGETLWVTEACPYGGYMHGAWRIGGDRLIMPVGEWDSGQFNIYSLADSTLLESIQLDGWYRHQSFAPLELPDGGWFGYAEPAEEGAMSDSCPARWNSDGSLSWALETSVRFGQIPILSRDGTLLVGSRGSFAAVDAESGATIWQQEGRTHYTPCGITAEGSFVVTALQDGGWLMLIDRNGNQVWETPVGSRGIPSNSDVVIYEDGSILVGHGWGLTLVSSAATVLWTLDNSDFELNEEYRMGHWTLNPTSDGRIVVSFIVYSDLDATFIYSLSSPAQVESG